MKSMRLRFVSRHAMWPVVFAVLAALVSVPAAAQLPKVPNCEQQTIFVDLTGFRPAEPPSPDYPFCGTLPIRGTLQGTYFTCYVADPAGTGGFSLFPLGSDPDSYAAYYAEWLQTNKGNLRLFSTGVGFFSDGLQAGLSKILPGGSTGDFAGATGYLVFTPEWHGSKPPSLYRLSGFVCR
jgi:hypothetical protein